MRARFEQFRETPEGLLAAIEHYSQAVGADPEFAAAYAGLAGAELMLGMSQPSDLTEALERAQVLALKAFEMDPELPEDHDILALIEGMIDEGMIDPLTAGDGGEPMTEVHVVRMAQPENVGVGRRVGRPGLHHRHLGGFCPRSERRRIQARFHIDLRELYTGGQPALSGVGRLGDRDRADGFGGSGPHGFGGPAAQDGGA
jgi:hypothetical protein